MSQAWEEYDPDSLCFSIRFCVPRQSPFFLVHQADFRGTDMAGCLMYRAEKQRARFDTAILSPTSEPTR